MHEARQQFLARPRRTDNQNAGVARRNPLGHREKRGGTWIGMYDGMLPLRRRGEDRSDQFGVGW